MRNLSLKAQFRIEPKGCQEDIFVSGGLVFSAKCKSNVAPDMHWMCNDQILGFDQILGSAVDTP